MSAKRGYQQGLSIGLAKLLPEQCPPATLHTAVSDRCWKSLQETGLLPTLTADLTLCTVHAMLWASFVRCKTGSQGRPGAVTVIDPAVSVT